MNDGPVQFFLRLNEQTVRFSRTILILSWLFVCSVSHSAETDKLPGQVIRISSTSVQPYKFTNRTQKGEEGIEVHVKFRVLDFPVNANQMRFEASFNNELHEKLFIADWQGYIGEYLGDPKRDEEADTPSDYKNMETRRVSPVRLQEMKKNKDYTMVFFVRPKKPKEFDRKSVLLYLRKEEKSFRFTLADRIMVTGEDT